MSSLFDPLSSTAAFGGGDDAEPWGSTPQSPKSSVPQSGRASPVPATPDKGPSEGLYGKDPQIYGQPDAGLISPRETLSSNGKSYEKPEPYLRARITGMDRNRRDILIRLDAQTNLPNFTGTTYRNVSRSYIEFQQFYETIVHSNPQTIILALPLAQTSAPTDEEDDRLVRIMLQRWITRVCEDPILLHDEDLRAFIESDFGYQPTPRPRKRASSGFSLIRRNVPDEDEELQRARFELTKLESQFFETAKAVDKVAATRKVLASAHSEMGNKLVNVATTEAHPPLGNAFRKIGRAWHSLADLDQAQAISECVILGDSLGYQGMNSRSAKETLQMRTHVLEEYQAAVKTTISKRRNIERLKASSNIRPERVDDALEDMEEADKYEQVLARRAEGISQNLHRALQTYNRHANEDITSALIEHARSSIMYERQLLRELEALRSDVANAAQEHIRPAPIPKPLVVPVLEEPARSGPSSVEPVNRPPEQPQRPQSVPHPQASIPNGNHASDPLGTPPRIQTPLHNTLPSPLSNPSSIARGGAASSGPTPQFLARQAQITAAMSASTSFASMSSAGPSSPRLSLPSSSPVAGPSTPSPTQTSFAKPTPEPAQRGNISTSGLGGRFVDGTQSMFVKPPSKPVGLSNHTQAVVSPSPSSDPLGGDPLFGSNVRASPSLKSPGLTPSSNGHALQNDLDPLSGLKPTYMSQSVRGPSTRSRLDAKEAASKLANMF